MAGAGAHRFRFFVDAACSAGIPVALAPDDAEHVRVLRLGAGDEVELVDPTGAVWRATVVGAASPGAALPVDRVAGARGAGLLDAPLELVAGALVGGRFDELVDGAVQAGATRIVPFADSARDRERLTSRRERLTRIARAAAKQSKRAVVPAVAEPIDRAALLALVPGIVLDADAEVRLDEVELAAGGAVQRVLVGPADGLARELLDELVAAGWRPARIGPSILRAELAAPVAVAIVAMRRG